MWTPYLTSGTYTLTLSVDDNRHSPVYTRKEPIVISNTTPPAAPLNLIATPQTDGSVLLTWNGNVVEPDVEGYRVSIDGADPQVQSGRLSKYSIFGLASGTTHQFAVSAYDFSGNIGLAAVTQATLLSNALNATSPGLNAKTRGINVVWFTFAQPITLKGFTLINDHGVVITGTATPITFSLSPDEELNLGAQLTTNIGSLPSGMYTATASVLDAATSAPINASWSFMILPPLKVYLPLVRRRAIVSNSVV